MTEAELVLGSLTPEELDDANRYTGWLISQWQVLTKTERHSVPMRTDGPLHALTALRLAVLREMTQRGGAEPWFVGMSTEGHVAQRVVDLYGKRYGYRDIEPRPAVNGQVERVCVICGQAQPQDAEHFDRPEGMWSSICRACNRVDPERYRDALEYSPRPPAAIAEQPTEDELLGML